MSKHHQTLMSGVGKCSVPMWMNGLPAGFCDAPAYGTQTEYGAKHTYPHYCPALACPAHGGPEPPANAEAAAAALKRAEDMTRDRWNRLTATKSDPGLALASLLALQGLLKWRDQMSADEAGYPVPDPGCLECTLGTTPTKYQTGLCPWHEAMRVVREAEKVTT